MKKLLEITRSNIVERAHFGTLILFENNKIISSFGHDKPGFYYYLRSCAKPLQAAICQDLGVFDFFGFTQEEIAVLCASHSGSFEHIAIIEGILEKLDLDISYLQCGTHLPLDRESKEYLLKNDLRPNPLHHNCSGKHVGFLAACIKEGYPLKNYLEPDHPLQQKIYEKINNLCNITDSSISKDGCGAPIMAMPFENMCIGFANCFKQYTIIKQSMSNNPYFSGGKNRIDSEIIFASKGKLIAKVGAEGLCMVYNCDTNQVLLVSILDSNEQARAFVLIQQMLDIGWLSMKDITKNPLNRFFDKEVKTNQGEVIGEVKTVFQMEQLNRLVKTF